MRYFVYVIQSQKDGGYYVGSSHDPRLRLEHHNDGWTRSTKGRGPWKIVLIEEYESKSQALQRERKIKRMKSREYIRRLIDGGSCPDPDLSGGSPVGPAQSN